jgi:HK97 family phage prohead protease
MPFGISQSQDDCDGWATVKQESDGSFITVACHATKQEAVDQMLAISFNEDIEPMGQVDKANVVDDDVIATRERPSLIAPAFMASSARRGLKLHEEGHSGDGLMPATVADARRMANDEPLSESKWRRIAPWIARHIVDLDAVQGDEITAGLVSMLLWGGGSSKESARRAQRYAERIVDRLDEERADAPAPKSDQITGSDVNEPMSADDKTGDITLSDATEKALQTKADEHNEAMKADDRPAWTRVRVGALRAVYRRGAGAFSTSHRPNMTRAQWAMARVNAFLYLARTGRPENEKYVGDNDLLHPQHPKYSDGRSRDESSVMLAHMTNNLELRWCAIGDDERRVAYTTFDVRQMPQGEGSTLFGYAAVFGSPSEPMPFVEYVMQGAFANTLQRGADVRLLIDHEGVPLARTTSGTLRLHEDERGLAVVADLDPSNPDAMRVMSALKRGDMSQMSFAFRTVRDTWSDDRNVRELNEVELYDVSVVTFPAYERTVAEIRSRQLQSIATLDSLTPRSIGVNVRRAQLALERLKF